MIWDVVIIGGGPAGVQASIYAASEGLKTLLLERAAIGGQIGQTPLLENFMVAGVVGGSITGPQLAAGMREQALRMGVEIILDEVTAITNDGDINLVSTKLGLFTTKSVIIATGAAWQDLTIPGIKAGISKDYVHYGPLDCLTANCHGKTVMVYGGGPSAGQAVGELAGKAKQVIFVMRSLMRMPQYLEERINGFDNVKQHVYSRLKRMQSNDLYLQVHGEDANGNNPFTYQLSDLFMCSGLVPATAWLTDSGINLSKDGRIITDSRFRTSIDGVFAVGDVRSGSTPRVGAAIGEGSAVISRLWEYFQAVGDKTNWRETVKA